MQESGIYFYLIFVLNAGISWNIKRLHKNSASLVKSYMQPENVFYLAKIFLSVQFSFLSPFMEPIKGFFTVFNYLYAFASQESRSSISCLITLFIDFCFVVDGVSKYLTEKYNEKTSTQATFFLFPRCLMHRKEMSLLSMGTYVGIICTGTNDPW